MRIFENRICAHAAIIILSRLHAIPWLYKSQQQLCSQQTGFTITAAGLYVISLYILFLPKDETHPNSSQGYRI